MIRTKEQSRLVDWLSSGRGLLLRYEELLATDAAPCADSLRAIIAARTPLLERVAQADAMRGDLPPGGDHEINELKALIDTLLGRLLGNEPVHQRLLRAERHWAELLTSDPDLDWLPDEKRLLHDLQQDSQDAIEALLACRV